MERKDGRLATWEREVLNELCSNLTVKEITARISNEEAVEFTVRDGTNIRKGIL